MSTDDPFADLETVDDRPEPSRRSGRSRSQSRPPRAPRDADDRPRRARPGGGSGGPGGRRPSASSLVQQPGFRLLAALIGAVVLIAIMTIVFKSCQKNKLVSSYRTYVTQASSITGDSKVQGSQLVNILSNPQGKTPADVTSQLKGLAQKAEALKQKAVKDLKPPDALRDENTSLISALTYRANGIRGLADKVSKVSEKTSDAEVAATRIAAEMKLFGASDVIYQQSWAKPTQAALTKEKIRGVEVTDKDVFLQNQDLLAPSVIKKDILPKLQRKTATTSTTGTTTTGTGNTHGNGVKSVIALGQASPTQLLPNTTVNVKGGTELKWSVTVENSGDFPETNVEVKATYEPTSGSAQTKSAIIDSIDSKQVKTVEVAGPDNPPFGETATLTVSVAPVAGEKNTDNNTFEYRVKINLP